MVHLRRSLLAITIVALVVFFFVGTASKSATPKWSMNASIIEACSCPMFCQCYFNPEPAGHAEHMMGGSEHNHGTTKLDGAKFWVAGDLGADFSKGQMDWAVLTFDPSVTKEQRDAVVQILGKLYPVKWNSFTVAPDQKISWVNSKETAVAKLDSGKAAEVSLKKFQGMTNEPVVIKNLKYWGAPRNAGFVLMPNSVEAYRLGDKAFEYKGTNGFMITFDIASTD